MARRLISLSALSHPPSRRVCVCVHVVSRLHEIQLFWRLIARQNVFFILGSNNWPIYSEFTFPSWEKENQKKCYLSKQAFGEIMACLHLPSFSLHRTFHQTILVLPHSGGKGNCKQGKEQNIGAVYRTPLCISTWLLIQRGFKSVACFFTSGICVSLLACLVGGRAGTRRWL